MALFVPRGRALASKKITIEAKKKKEEEFRANKNYVSEEIKQCPNSKNVKNNKTPVDIIIREIGNSCDDLAIDG